MYTISISRATIAYSTKYHNFHKALNSSFNGYAYKDGIVTLYYASPLAEETQAAIQLADVSFVDNDPFQFVKTTILVPARAFGNEIIDDFAAENIVLGITQAGLTNHVRKTCKEVTDALRSGSLYDALHEVRQIPEQAKDPTFLSNSRLLVFVNKIETYLGLPLSTQL
jgi:hypothetical protein